MTPIQCAKFAGAFPVGLAIAWTAILVNRPAVLAWADRVTLRIGKWAELEDED